MKTNDNNLRLKEEKRADVNPSVVSFIKVIETKHLNDLYSEFKDFGHEDENFKDFVETTTDDGVYLVKGVTHTKHLLNKTTDDEHKKIKAVIEKARSETGLCPICLCLWDGHSIEDLEKCRLLKRARR